MRNRLIGLTLSVYTTPPTGGGWTTVVLAEHLLSGEYIIRSQLSTNIGITDPVSLAEVMGPTLIEEAFWSDLPASPGTAPGTN